MGVGSAQLLGRNEELNVLSDFLSHLQDSPGALLFQGEAGIGKTTLWRCGVQLARDEQCRVLSCSPQGGEVQLSFAALGDLLDGALDEVLPALPLPRRRALEVALLLADPRGSPPDQRAVALAFLSVLRILATEQRVLVAIDDVQWLDAPSARILEFAVRRLESEPIGLLLTQRVDGSSSRMPVEIERGAAGVRTVRVGPLSLGALHHLLRVKLGTNMSRPTLRRVHAASGGNPFFALEIVRALQRRGGNPDPGRPLAVPDALRELVRDRIADLSPETRTALATAAALARPGVAAFGREALDEALEAGVIELDGELVHFTHPLLPSVAYDALGEAQRRRIHRRLATLVDDAEERARHLALGALEPDVEVAERLDEAVQLAAARGATDSACELADLAIRLTPAERPDDRIQRKLALADLQVRAGDVASARSALESLRAEVPSGPLRAAVLLKLCRARADDADEMIAIAEEALAEVGEEHALASEIHASLAIFYRWRDGLDRARPASRAAVECAERGQDPTRLAASLAALGYDDEVAGDPRGDDFWMRALALEDAADSSIYWRPSLAYAAHLIFSGRLDEARPYVQAASDRAAASGYEWSSVEAEWWHSELERRAGNWSAAHAHAESCVQIAEELELEQDQSGALYQLAMIEAHLGLVEPARTHAESALALAEAAGDTQGGVLRLAALGFLELSLGNVAAAAERLRLLWPLLVSRGYGQPSFAPILPNAIESLIALGEIAEARELLEQFEERGRALDSAEALASAARCRGLLHAAEGDPEAGLSHMEQALAEHERASDPFERGRTLLALGQILRRAKRKRAARESLLEALACFDGLGARLWAEKAQSELARIGGRRKVGAELTASEQRLSEFIAAGCSNKTAAAALFVTPRTVEQKLSRIYAKLGIHSRTELTRWVLERQRDSKV